MTSPTYSRDLQDAARSLGVCLDDTESLPSIRALTLDDLQLDDLQLDDLQLS